MSNFTNHFNPIRSLVGLASGKIDIHTVMANYRDHLNITIGASTHGEAELCQTAAKRACLVISRDKIHAAFLHELGVFKSTAVMKDFPKIVPIAEAVADIPELLGLLACISQTSAGDFWADRLATCQYCNSFFVRKTKKNCKFCSNKCRWEQGNKKKKGGG